MSELRVKLRMVPLLFFRTMSILKRIASFVIEGIFFCTLLTMSSSELFAPPVCRTAAAAAAAAAAVAEADAAADAEEATANPGGLYESCVGGGS